MIESNKIPQVRLEEVFRQAAVSKIILGAHAINKGSLPSFLKAQPKIQKDSKVDLQFIQAEDPDSFLSCLSELLTDAIPNHFGFKNPLDCQVLTPMNRGELGTVKLNQYLQELLNAKKPKSQIYTRGDTEYREGDKVIQVQNNYELNVYNGDIGYIKQVNFDNKHILISYGERLIKYSKDQMSEVRHAFAVTIHKSQGSEFPAVIVPLSTHHYMMLQRNLIYTALTRAKKMAFFIGSEKALWKAVNTIDSRKRQTFLKQRI
jgi:exodeoxyribonuclease V alpha subunit